MFPSTCFTVPAWSARASRLALAFLLLAVPAFAQESGPPQGPENLPTAVEGGILFRCFAPDATSIYLAGEFNNWADNTDGAITNADHKMDGPDDQGIYRKIVRLAPGSYKFKFAINGEIGRWFAPDWAEEVDADGNATLYVTPSGHPLVRSDVNTDWRPQIDGTTVTFRIYRPQAKEVYLAGDFNEWGKNQNGLVTDAAFTMEGPDGGGVWTRQETLTPGRHAYKFVIDGASWEHDPNIGERDAEDHSIIEVK